MIVKLRNSYCNIFFRSIHFLTILFLGIYTSFVFFINFYYISYSIFYFFTFNTFISLFTHPNPSANELLETERLIYIDNLLFDFINYRLNNYYNIYNAINELVHHRFETCKKSGSFGLIVDQFNLHFIQPRKFYKIF